MAALGGLATAGGLAIGGLAAEGGLAAAELFFALVAFALAALLVGFGAAASLGAAGDGFDTVLALFVLLAPLLGAFLGPGVSVATLLDAGGAAPHMAHALHWHLMQ